ncbi:MAG TPA: CCA tRNA nucleotidyltransferase [Candidatus Margulisiibacteriota bacterium]|nr:CCA tRNA nucleotidyltransferase [Candidatus Margulisiibacteriota bacterium]
MKEYLDRLPEDIKKVISLASGIALEEKMNIYLVGGFVRDLLLKTRNLDLDIVVEGDGIKLASSFASLSAGRITRHHRFGTATVFLKPHLKIDISTARREYYPAPAHLPVVSPGSLKDDLCRRDFTINAMAIDISKPGFGRLIDYFGGRQDLRRGYIRVLHDNSFVDDPTRILRSVRFQQRYNFKIEPGTLKKLKEALRLGMLEKVQPQRIRDDLILMLKETDPLGQVRRLKALSGLSFIHPRLSVDKKTIELLRKIEREIKWFRKAHPARRALDNWLIYFMGLLDGLPLKEASAVCRRLVLRNGEEKRVHSYKKISRPFLSKLSGKRIKPSQVFSMLEPLSYEVLIILRAKYRNPGFKKRLDDFFRTYNGMRIHVNGDDLRMLGIKPGPRYQKIFWEVLKSKLDGEVKSKEEELALIRRML